MPRPSRSSVEACCSHIRTTAANWPTARCRWSVMSAVLAPSRTSDAARYNFIFATKDGFLISKRDISKHISKHISKTIKKHIQSTNLPIFLLFKSSCLLQQDAGCQVHASGRDPFDCNAALNNFYRVARRHEPPKRVFVSSKWRSCIQSELGDI